MSIMMDHIERGIERGDYTAEEFEECAEMVLEMREKYPEAWSSAIIAGENVLQAVVEDENGA